MEASLEQRDFPLNKIPENILSECKNYALGFKKEECCGIIMSRGEGLVFKACDNIHSNKEGFFAINPVNLIEDEVEYIFHSHWNGGSRPSSCDIRSSEELCIPFLIYSLTDDDFYLYRSMSV